VASTVWSLLFQWTQGTGGSKGLVGIWPVAALLSKTAYYLFALGIVALALAAIAWLTQSPLGYALRGSRDSALRAEALGIDVKRVQWLAFSAAGLFAGLAGALYAFSKGSISPDTLSIPRSIDALVMVLLGGINALAGQVLGATAFTWMQDSLARATDYRRAAAGALI